MELFTFVIDFSLLTFQFAVADAAKSAQVRLGRAHKSDTATYHS